MLSVIDLLTDYIDRILFPFSQFLQGGSEFEHISLELISD